LREEPGFSTSRALHETLNKTHLIIEAQQSCRSTPRSRVAFDTHSVEMKVLGPYLRSGIEESSKILVFVQCRNVAVRSRPMPAWSSWASSAPSPNQPTTDVPFYIQTMVIVEGDAPKVGM
jgi:hypothetical protein